jgi:DNA-damage-inducible protein J
MPRNQLVQARVDGEVKAQATAVLAAMGLTLSDAVRVLLTKLAREKVMPPELFTPNETTIAAMEDARLGKGETVTLDEIRAAIRAND